MDTLRRTRSLGVGALAVLLGATVAAGCGGSSHSAAATASATTTPTALSIAQQRADYLSAVAVYNAAGSKFLRQFNSLPQSATATQLAAISVPLANALQTTDTRLLAIPFTGQTRTDVDTLARDSAAVIGVLDTASGVTADTADQWDQGFVADFTKTHTDADIIRTDLGLPQAPAS